MATIVPRDANNVPITQPTIVSKIAIDETYDASISASTAITLNVATTLIEVSATDKGIFMKWGATAASTDFDEFIPANTSKTFVVPASGAATVEFIEEAATAHLVVIEK